VSLRVSISGAIVALSLTSAALAQSQQPAGDAHQHHDPTPQTLTVPHEREGSGTSWLPDATPLYAIHRSFGGWDTMFHGIAFLQYLHDERPRGHEQFGSINWLMASASRRGAHGALTLRGMFSLEPLTIDGCGYPDLLASGELCDGTAIVDRQHPHDLVMEASASYERQLASGLGLQVYAGLAGEPALGPVAFPHRISAMMNPLAPVSHHWLDASHLTFGVLTGGVYDRRWKLEGSLFNGREPDDERYGIDLAALDSYSGRVAFLPSPRWSLQFSAGHLEEAEEHEDDRVDVNRVTASAIHHVPRDAGGVIATTIAWGRNGEEDEATHALLAESMLSISERHVFFGRAELTQKTSHDLRIAGVGDEIHNVGKLQAGYTRFVGIGAAWRAGLGASVSLGIVPDDLSSTYGGRVTPGIAVFLTVRPGVAGHVH
jgi:hypothetical protein